MIGSDMNRIKSVVDHSSCHLINNSFKINLVNSNINGHKCRPSSNNTHNTSSAIPSNPIPHGVAQWVTIPIMIHMRVIFSSINI